MLGFLKFNETDYSGHYHANDVACYLIHKAIDNERPISNLQLQKILYYIQVFFLQEKRYALFSDEIEAWRFGPVVRSVYEKYSGFGASDLIDIDAYNVIFSSEEKRAIDKILDEKSKLYPWSLVADTHKRGKAWDLIYQGGPGNKEIIPKELLKKCG